MRTAPLRGVRQAGRLTFDPPGGRRPPRRPRRRWRWADGIPWVLAVNRPAVARRPALTLSRGEPELLDRHQAVMRIAQIARVFVGVRPTMRQRDGVVDDRRLARPPDVETHLAQAVRTLQPPQPLRLAGAAAEPLRRQAVTVPVCSARSRMNVSVGVERSKPNARSLAPSLPASAALTAALSTLGFRRR